MSEDDIPEKTPDTPVVEDVPPANETEKPENIEVSEEPETDLVEDQSTPEIENKENEASKKPGKKKLKLKRPSKKILLIVAIVGINVIIAATGTALVVASNNQSSPAQAKTAAITSESKPTTPASSEEPIKPEIIQQHYTAETLKAEFDYPSDWQITSNTDDTSIYIQSPITQIKDSSGQLVDAQLTINITAKYAGSQGGLITAKSVISANSETISYKSPTKVQRKMTHMSFASIDSSELDSIGASFISGNLNYYFGSTIGSQNFERINPFIVITIQKCDANCETNQFLKISPKDFNANKIVKEAKTIIKSFKLN